MGTHLVRSFIAFCSDTVYYGTAYSATTVLQRSKTTNPLDIVIRSVVVVIIIIQRYVVVAADIVRGGRNHR